MHRRRSIVAFGGLALGLALGAGGFVPRPALAGATCGDGQQDEGEECDDANTLAGDGCSATCQIEGPLGKDAQRCVVAVNGAFVSAMGRSARSVRGCIADVSRGATTQSFEECVAGADLAAALTKTQAADGKRCVAKGVTTQTAFGYRADPVLVTDQGVGAARLVATRLLGAPAAVAPASAKDDARCQQAVSAGAASYLSVLAKESLKTKRQSLPIAASRSGLEDALSGVPGSLKIARALARLGGAIEKKCPGASLATLFPAECADAPSPDDLAVCAASVARCAHCLALNAADGLALDCDGYSGGACLPGSVANLTTGTIVLDPSSPTCSQLFTLSVEIKNVGDAPTAASGIISVIDTRDSDGSEQGNNIGGFPILDAGGSFSVDVPFSIGTFYNETHDLTIRIDPGEQIPQSTRDDDTVGVQYTLAKGSCP